MFDDSYQAAPIIYRSDRFLSRTLLRLLPRFISPNDITFFRFLTIPFVLYLMIGDYYRAAFALFTLSALSDLLDGALARSSARVTDWGKLFDPLADKLLVGSVVAVVVSQFISLYLAIGIISVEFCLVATAYYWKRRERSKTIEANWSGKTKMWLQCSGIILAFSYLIFGVPLILTLATIVLHLGLGFGIVSLVIYRSI